MEGLLERLRAACGEEHVITHPHQLRTYESDGLLHYAVTPGAVVLPGSAEEVAACVRACFDHRTPFVARGAGSGLSGGALPVADGIVIGLSRLRRVLEVDLDNGRIARRAGRHERGGLGGRRSRLLLPAGSLEPDRLHDRRQRRRELGRRPLPEVRLHHQLRDRRRGRPQRRHCGRGRRAAGGPARVRPARRAGRLGGHARGRDEGLAARRAGPGRRADARGVLRLTAGRGRGRDRDHRRRRRARARSR